MPKPMPKRRKNISVSNSCAYGYYLPSPNITKIFVPLKDTYIGNNLTAHRLVDALNKLGAHHRKVLAQSRTKYFDEQRLVLYKLIASVSRHTCAHNLRPSVYSTTLKERSLQSFVSQIHIKQVANRLHIASKHSRK